MNYNGRNRKTWEETLLKLAFEIAELRSPDPFVQVGACARKYDNQLIIGYNGAPSGIEIDWQDREERRKRVIHAEANVLGEVKKNEIMMLACTHLPCPECIKLIGHKKVPVVIYRHSLYEYAELVKQLAEEFNVKLIQL